MSIGYSDLCREGSERSGFVHNWVWHEVSNEDQIDSIIEFETGAVAHLEMSSIARAGKAAVRILGTKGAVVDMNMWDGELSLYTEVGGLPVETKVRTLKDDWLAYYRNIADHLLNGAELAVEPEQAARTIAVIETTEQSAAAGHELPLCLNESELLR